MHLAQELEQEGNHRAAEKHYVEAGDWKSAVHMYRYKGECANSLRIAIIFLNVFVFQGS